jgi:hypothetical protein
MEESVDTVIVPRTDLVHMVEVTVADITILLLLTPQQRPQRLVLAVQPLELITLPSTLSTMVLLLLAPIHMLRMVDMQPTSSIINSTWPQLLPRDNSSHLHLALPALLRRHHQMKRLHLHHQEVLLQELAATML